MKRQPFRQAHPVHATPERVEVHAPRYELLLFPVLVIAVLLIVVVFGAQPVAPVVPS